MKSEILVSVIMPVYNSERYVAEAIESFLADCGESAEMICVDDGSTDGTARILKDLGDAVRYDFQEHAGVNAARNRAVKLARGKFLMFFDSDDLCEKGRLSLQLEAFRQDPETDVVFGHVKEFLSPDREENLKEKFLPAAASIAGCMPGAMMIKRESFLRAGFFKPDLGLTSFMEWYARAKEAGLKIRMIEDTILLRRIHGNNFSLQERSRLGAQYAQTLKFILDRKRGGSENAEKDKPEAVNSATKSHLSKGHELLLKAAFLEKEQALLAWERWRAGHAIEEGDAQSARIFPLLVNRFSQFMEDSLRAKLKGVGNRNWYLNQIFFHEIQPFLETLDAKRKDFFLAKGPALLLGHYKDFGLRLMDDFEIGVPGHEFRAIINLAKKEGWRTGVGHIPDFRGILFYKASEKHPFLRWRLISFESPHQFWKSRIEAAYDGKKIAILDPAAQFFYTCRYASRWGRPKTGLMPDFLIQWIVDAAQIAASNAINWNQFWSLAEDRGSVSEIKEMLYDLKDILKILVPNSIMERIKGSPGVAGRADWEIAFAFWLRRTAGIFKDTAACYGVYF